MVKEYNQKYDFEILPSLEGCETLFNTKDNLNEKSWVVILSDSQSNKSSVYIFNNEQLPEEYQYSDFQDFCDITFDDLRQYDKNNLFKNKKISQYSGLNVDKNGINCQVIDIFNGGVTIENIQSVVNKSFFGIKEVITEFLDERDDEYETRREARFRP